LKIAMNKRAAYALLSGAVMVFVVGGWFLLSVLLARRIPRWLGIQRHATGASFAFFVLLLVAPVAQDIVGMWQFERLISV